ncbi:MAG: hypothetical protein EOM23_08130, partial [Candidatus Moranbacteria bacterium]|nr:hypothetical protein [Candidatus Moranbacteria bacterium]
MNNFKNLIVSCAIIFLTGGPLVAKNTGSVAIVADSQVMQKNKASLEKYARSIEADGLKTFIIEDIWGVPDSIRNVLEGLYRESNLEGAVFVGNIPVPMIRDGQHLATAFKMDQRRDWDRSSIPSDRFYDDFDLEFDFIKRDSANTLYYYYSLSPDGAES